MHRFNLSNALAELLGIGTLGIVASGIVASLVTVPGYARRGASFAPVVTVAGAVVFAVAAALFLWRWRRRIVATESGVALVRGPGLAPVAIPWNAIAEIHERGSGTPRLMIVGSDGSRIRITDSFSDSATLIAAVRRRARESVVGLLESEWTADGCMSFRHPGARLAGHLEFVASACGVASLGALTWHVIRTRGPWETAMPLFVSVAIAAVVGFALFRVLRTHAVWRGARVMLSRHGVRVARLDGTTDIVWSDVTGSDYAASGELVIGRTRGRPVRVPVTIANVGYLQHYIQAFARRS